MTIRHTWGLLRFCLASAFLVSTSLLLAGCGTNFAPHATLSESSGGPIKGTVHGGQQPVSNAHIYVMQASAAGYGSASSSLITTGYSGNDAVGNYILSDSAGEFDLTGSYTCTSGAQVYVLAEQGNPGLADGTDNTAIGLMAALGTCPNQVRWRVLFRM